MSANQESINKLFEGQPPYVEDAPEQPPIRANQEWLELNRSAYPKLIKEVAAALTTN